MNEGFFNVILTLFDWAIRVYTQSPNVAPCLCSVGSSQLLKGKIPLCWPESSLPPPPLRQYSLREPERVFPQQDTCSDCLARGSAHRAALLALKSGLNHSPCCRLDVAYSFNGRRPQEGQKICILRREGGELAG